MSDPTRISAEQNIVIDVVGDIIQGMEKSNNTSSDSAERPNIVNKSGKSSKTSASSNSKSGKSIEHESNKKQQKTDQIGAGPSTSSSKSLRHGSSKSDQKARSNQKHEKSSSKDKGKPSSSNDLTDIKNQLSVLTKAMAQVTPIIPMVQELKTAYDNAREAEEEFQEFEANANHESGSEGEISDDDIEEAQTKKKKTNKMAAEMAATGAEVH